MIDNHAWPDGKPDWATGYVCGRLLEDGWQYMDGPRWLVVQRLYPDRGRVTICTPDINTLEAY